jgi:NTP pyrophosphatase (non-canonical NTP hydrolase)
MEFNCTDLKLKYLPKLAVMVQNESDRQVQKWGIQTRTPFEWSNYITEELGELAQAIGDHAYGRDSKHHVIEEAIQVATLALKIAEMYKFGGLTNE